MSQSGAEARVLPFRTDASSAPDLYRQIFLHSADAIAIIDSSGRYLEQNQAHRELVGYSDEELAGATPAIHLGEAGFQQIAQALQGQGKFRGEVMSRTRSGETRHVEITAFAVADREGKAIGYVGIKRDVTRRKQAEEALAARVRELEHVYALTSKLSRAAEADEIYQAAMQAVLGATGADRASILIFDEKNVMRFRAWHGLSEQYRAAVDGHSPWRADERNAAPILVTDVLAEASLAPYAPVIAAEGIRALGFIPITFEGRLLGKFMVYFNQPHEFSADEVHVSQALATPVAIAIERRRADEAMRRSEKLAAAGRLAATVAHEINNPLAAAVNLTFLLRSDASLSDGAREFVAQLDGELARVAQIVKQTLGFFRDNGAVARFSLGDTVNGLVSLYQHRLNMYGIRAKVSVAEDLAVHASHGELRQVISNLIANAIDAMSAGGELHIEARRLGEQQAIELVIRDTGEGISRENLPRIFEPFFTTKKDIGTGLGLWVAKGIVEKHGGTIDVRSEVGPEHGTTFTLHLPVSATISG